MLCVLIFKLFGNIKCTVMFCNIVQLILTCQGNIQRVQSKGILTLLNKNKENMLHHGIFEKKEH